MTCWRISIIWERSTDKKRLKTAILKKIEDSETEQVCL